MSATAMQLARHTLSALKGALRGGADEDGSRPVAEVIARLRALSAEHARLEVLVEDVRREQIELQERIDESSRKRIDALARARRDGEAASRELADRLLAEIADLNRGLEEARALEVRFAAEAREAAQRVDALAHPYRAQRAAFLDEMMEVLMARYMERAPELAEVVVQIAALRRVMVALASGDTNGWNGRVYLPTMSPKEGRALEAIADGAAREFDLAAEERTREIYEALHRAGFKY